MCSLDSGKDTSGVDKLAAETIYPSLNMTIPRLRSAGAMVGSLDSDKDTSGVDKLAAAICGSAPASSSSVPPPRKQAQVTSRSGKKGKKGRR